MRPLVYVLAVAFVIWLVLAVTGHADAPTDETPTTSPEPPPAPATDPRVEELEAELQLARRRLAVSQAARRRERRGFRHRLRVVIHSNVLSGHWLERAFLCIHSGEGAWSANTGNGYFGGLQMDLAFQRTYAPWALRSFGTANRWPAAVQVAAAIEAWTSRGFYPWPNTARVCGLIR